MQRHHLPSHQNQRKTLPVAHPSVSPPSATSTPGSTGATEISSKTPPPSSIPTRTRPDRQSERPKPARSRHPNSNRARPPARRRRRIHPGLHLPPHRRPRPQPHRPQTCRGPSLRPPARLHQREIHHHRALRHLRHTSHHPHQIRPRSRSSRHARSSSQKRLAAEPVPHNPQRDRGCIIMKTYNLID